jgi:hypothetical protein
VTLPDLVAVRLVPVEVFGTSECCEHGYNDDNCPSIGFGLSDAVSSWSDCNRAAGRIYRIDDQVHREPGETITVWVPREQIAWFEQVWSSATDVTRGHATVRTGTAPAGP